MLWRQPWLVLTHLPLPPGVVSCRVVPRSGKAGGKQAKRPVPAGSPRTQETRPRDSISPKKKKMVVCWEVKHAKSPWEGKPDRDGVAAGGSGQQAGGSKRRASEDANVPTLVLKRPRSPGDAGQQSALHLLPARPLCPLLIEKVWSVEPHDMQPQDRLLRKKSPG